MGKFLKGVIKFSAAAATVGGVCYVFKDRIKQSKFYQEYDVDGKLDKVKTTIKDKISSADNEEDIVEEDELFFDDIEADGARDYVSLNSEGAADTNDSDTATAEADANEEESKNSSDNENDNTNDSADESSDKPEIPTIDLTK